jgi:hypothetical protein
VDGGQHKSFQAAAKRGTLVVSQPQALADAGREVVIGSEANAQPASPSGPKSSPAQAKGGAAKPAIVPVSASAPAPDRPFYQRLFDAITPSPAPTNAGRT